MQHPDKLDQALSRLYRTNDAPESFETGWRAAIRREESIQMTEKNHHWNRWLRRLAPVCAAVVLVAGALWTGTLDDAMTPAEHAPAGNETVMMMSSRASGSSSYSSVTNAKMDDVTMEAVAYDTADAGFESLSAAPIMEGGSITYEGEIQEYVERKLVRTTDLTLHTQTFDATADQMKQQLEAIGGYVENLYQYGEENRRLNLSMRVPVESLDRFIADVEGMGRITNRNESTTDMTTTFVDNQARLDTLLAKRDRLNELLAEATEVSDLIEIESAIADTQYQIDSYESMQRSINRDVSYSQMSVTLVEETPSDTANAPELSLGERIRAALKASVEWTGEFLRDMLVFVVMILPILIPAAIVIALVVILRRKNKKK